MFFLFLTAVVAAFLLDFQWVHFLPAAAASVYAAGLLFGMLSANREIDVPELSVKLSARWKNAASMAEFIGRYWVSLRYVHSAPRRGTNCSRMSLVSLVLAGWHFFSGNGAILVVWNLVNWLVLWPLGNIVNRALFVLQHERGKPDWDTVCAVFFSLAENTPRPEYKGILDMVVPKEEQARIVASYRKGLEHKEKLDSPSSDTPLNAGSEATPFRVSESSGTGIRRWVGIAVATGVVGLVLGLNIGNRKGHPFDPEGPQDDKREIVSEEPSVDSPAYGDTSEDVDKAAVRAQTEALAGEAIELGALVRLFLLSDSEHATWAIGAEPSSPVRWVTDGLASGNSVISSQRIGYARVVVDGERMTAVRRQVEELAWEVALGSELPPKFGPQFVSIQPDLDCFGSTGSGCYFEIDATLRSADVDFRRLCMNAPYGNGLAVYLLSGAGVQPAWLVYSIGTGSGGLSRAVTIYWREADFSADVQECMRNQDR